MKVIHTHTGKIYVDRERRLEFLTVGDYGKENNIKADFWGYTKENNPGTIGKMWVDEVVLRELPRITGRFKGIGHYYYAADGIKGSLFSLDYSGKVTLKVSAQNKSVSKEISVKPGENSFTISWKDFPVGAAVISAAGGNINIQEKIMIQRVRE